MSSFGKARAKSPDLHPAYQTFKYGNKSVADMIDEMYRLPWARTKLSQIKNSIAYNEEISEAQQSMVTAMYIDCCVINDEEIEKQVEARKLNYRMYVAGIRNPAIASMLRFSNHQMYTPKQIKLLYKLALDHKLTLAHTPHLDDTNFDGWNILLSRYKVPDKPY